MDQLHHHLQHILEALQGFELTPWKAVGFLGTAMFTSRWFVQLYYTRKYKRVVMPLAFWWLSVCGSALLLSYFVFGKNDSVGILSNSFPVVVSVYNLVVHSRDLRSRKAAREAGEAQSGS
ncbi:lipid-A-disaccharide synthase N-terminal domain-containing protein [Oleiagrimonas sp. MCCC 1A03011]|uniref:lipid-A-disaccharide synthase N-terminal domain-containing protein n=1 Tax=Oleiagrimonas sp. MCCC 1A03011 TaxID=1926883 RepID=UPI000DC2921C|nr:lipid-A-disaccharide synthase N-terminal domain-containing protein [Oleiagrimonas sp. MCCC 1A03011]RAP56315.1 lipid A biosynthesis acyltransferase [Oleiagrimonas sp. MCCC 1A03011]